ncbi:hypothetical protein N9H45_05320 [Opitutales bacterium]|nr:hypothetical protein [Opitutales bacterium]
MKSCILTFLFSLILGTTLAHGAVHNVVSGQDLQSVIDSASSGDQIRLLSATYGDIEISTKDLSFKSTGATPAFLGNVRITGSDVEFIRVSASTLEADDLPNHPGKLILTQGTFNSLDINCSKSSLLYCEIEHLVIAKQGLVVGCNLDGKMDGGIGIDIHGSDTIVTVRNSRIHDYSKTQSEQTIETLIGILVHKEASAFIENNLIYDCYENSRLGTEIDCGMGIFIKPNSDASILGNVLWNCFIAEVNHFGQKATRGDSLIYAPLGTILRHNILWKNSNVINRVKGTVTGNENLEADPKFTDIDNGDFSLASDSPAINAGPPDPQYNDRDGSRNDIGMFGGHNFIPDGRTTNKPIVLGLDVAPIAVPTGGTVTIESTGATVK